MEGLDSYLLEEIEKLVSRYVRRHISNTIILGIKLDTCRIEGLMVDDTLSIIIKYNSRTSRIVSISKLETSWLIQIYKKLKYLVLYKEASIELKNSKPLIYDPLLKKFVSIPVTEEEIQSYVMHKMKKPIAEKKKV